MAALRAGKHVFVEKPLCIDAGGAGRDRGAAVEELGERCPILMVGFNRRFAPATRELRGSSRASAPARHLATASRPGRSRRSTGRRTRRSAGAGIVGEACHAIDTCTALAGSPPVRVFAESVAKVGGAARRRTTASSSRCGTRTGRSRASPTRRAATGASRRERIEVFGGGRTALVDAWDRIELWQGGRPSEASGGKDKGHRAEFEAFLAACRAGGAWPIPWEQLHGGDVGVARGGAAACATGAPYDRTEHARSPACAASPESSTTGMPDGRSTATCWSA